MNLAELPAEAQEYIRDLEESWQKKYGQLLDEYRLLLYKRFGRSSERIDETHLIRHC